MVMININADCGNAPKKLFLQNFLVATVRLDTDFVTHNITDDIRWELVGDRCLSGKQEVLSALVQFREKKPTEMIVNTIITHGYDGAANGTLKFQDGSSIAFSHVYLFRASTNNAPIKAITTYMIALS